MHIPSPARVALVMTYPYEAFVGGENSYVAALRQYLVGRGHTVDTLISDVTRGRHNPVLKLPPQIEKAGRLHVRRTRRLGQHHHLALDPALILRSCGALLGRRKRQTEVHSEGERRWLLRSLRRGRYDAVILMWDAVRYAKDVSRLCDKVLALKGFCVGQRIRRGEAPTIIIPEQTVSELADASLIGMNNAAEAQALGRHLPEKRIIHVGMGFPEQLISPPGNEPRILFVGANTGANLRSLEWLLDDVWPRISAQRPDAQLRVAGSIRNAWHRPVPTGAELLGRVESLEDEYRRAQVVVAPITVGTAGVKIKVAEALSFGRPLVSTSPGVDPADPAAFGEAVDVTDDPQLFADAVCRLLNDPDLRERRSRQATDAFHDNFSCAAAYGALSEHLAL